MLQKHFVSHMNEILNKKILDDIREWIAIDKDNSVQMRSGDLYIYIIYDHTNVIPNINILDNYSNIRFSTKRCVWHLCNMTILNNNIEYIHFLPTHLSINNLKIWINTNGSVSIRTIENSLRDDTIPNCYTMESIYSYIQHKYLSGENIKDDSWSVHNYFQKIPKFTSFQYLLDQYNQPVIEGIVIEI